MHLLIHRLKKDNLYSKLDDTTVCCLSKNRLIITSKNYSRLTHINSMTKNTYVKLNPKI